MAFYPIHAKDPSPATASPSPATACKMLQCAVDFSGKSKSGESEAATKHLPVAAAAKWPHSSLGIKAILKASSIAC